MIDHIANAYARLAGQADGAPEMSELRAVLLALRSAQNDVLQYRSDCSVYQRQIAEQAATIAALRTDLEMLKRPVAVVRTDQRLVDALIVLKTVVETAVDAGAGRQYHHVQTRRGAFLHVVPALEQANAALAASMTPADGA